MKNRYHAWAIKTEGESLSSITIFAENKDKAKQALKDMGYTEIKSLIEIKLQPDDTENK